MVPIVKGKNLKVAVLWSHPSGYLYASIMALVKEGCDVFLSCFEATDAAPYSISPPAEILANLIQWPAGRIDLNRLQARLDDFQPDITLISGWNHVSYRRIARRFEGKTIRVLCMDNPWEETARQWIGRILAHSYIAPLYDAAFVGGERQYQFARRLGFDDALIYQGVFSCDRDNFRRQLGTPPPEDRFLYVGRLSAEKGIDDLVTAYLAYREMVANPWQMTVAGVGPRRSVLEGIPGLVELGFVQPSELARILHSSRVMLVPSRREPWGVQIHEAATAGLPIIVTSVCGAAPHLVRHGFNGLWVSPRRPTALAAAMKAISERTDLTELGRRSQMLSEQFTPSLWALQVKRIMDRSDCKSGEL